MKIFEEMARYGHEQLIFCQEKTSGLKSIIAIHDTTLGPALGGCRMWPYAIEEEVITDALRLSRGMTYKSGAAGVNWGGGKAVIWGNPKTDKTEELFRAFGHFVCALGGRFITGTDVGTTAQDFVFAAEEGKNFVALPEAYGGSGDSSVITAFGVWKGLKACAKHLWGNDSLQGKKIAIQGVGKVGSHLMDYLAEEGVEMTITDINPDFIARALAKHPSVNVVKPEEIFDTECDVFSPNALGAVINDETIPRLKCKVVAGAANNQLADLRHARMLKDRGILYAPDYVINAGGLIQVADELHGFNKDRAFHKTAQIYEMLLTIFAIAERQNITTAQAADIMVEQRIEHIGRIKRMYKKVR